MYRAISPVTRTLPVRRSRLLELKKAQDSTGWTCVPQQTLQEGTTHEIIG